MNLQILLESAGTMTTEVPERPVGFSIGVGVGNGGIGRELIEFNVSQSIPTSLAKLDKLAIKLHTAVLLSSAITELSTLFYNC